MIKQEFYCDKYACHFGDMHKINSEENIIKMLTRVIVNQKGGVGKSSITVNLAAISAHQGLKTLVIDLDSKSNASQYILGDDATYSADKPTLELNIENYFQ